MSRLTPVPQAVHSASPAVTIRFARRDDAIALDRLAQLDARSALEGPVLVAEVGDELWAAVELRGGAAAADPFRRSGELVHLLRARARQLDRAAAPPRRLGRALRWAHSGA